MCKKARGQLYCVLALVRQISLDLYKHVDVVLKYLQKHFAWVINPKKNILERAIIITELPAFEVKQKKQTKLVCAPS